MTLAHSHNHTLIDELDLLFKELKEFLYKYHYLLGYF